MVDSTYRVHPTTERHLVTAFTLTTLIKQEPWRVIMWCWVGTAIPLNDPLPPPVPCSDEVPNCKECREEAGTNTVTCTDCNPGFTHDMTTNECKSDGMFLPVTVSVYFISVSLSVCLSICLFTCLPSLSVHLCLFDWSSHHGVLNNACAIAFLV